MYVNMYILTYIFLCVSTDTYMDVCQLLYKDVQMSVHEYILKYARLYVRLLTYIEMNASIHKSVETY